jgi:hypothetical protein
MRIESLPIYVPVRGWAAALLVAALLFVALLLVALLLVALVGDLTVGHALLPAPDPKLAPFRWHVLFGVA